MSKGSYIALKISIAKAIIFYYDIQLELLCLNAWDKIGIDLIAEKEIGILLINTIALH